MRRLGSLLAPWLLVAGCGGEVRQEFDVGAHHVSIATGPSWQHVDQGRRHLLRREDVQLVIEDLGPGGREGIRCEIERAHALWRRGQDREARSAMAMVPVAPEFFATPDQRRAFWNAWHEVSGAPDGLRCGRGRGTVRPAARRDRGAAGSPGGRRDR